MTKTPKIIYYSTPDQDCLISKIPTPGSVVCYEVLVTRRSKTNLKYVYHVENFFGMDGRKVRSEAIRWARSGAKFVGWRNKWFTCGSTFEPNLANFGILTEQQVNEAEG